MKKIIYQILYAINIIALILMIVYLILFARGHSTEELSSLLTWRMNSAYFVIVFWIWNMIIWSKRDKKIIRFFALFFLPGLFTLYYFFLVIKNKWLEKEYNNGLQQTV
jgi:hypothetical protein